MYQRPLAPLSVFGEFAADVPQWVSPLDGVGWLRAVMAYTDSQHPERLAQLDRLRAWRAPTWDDHFEVVEDFLERLT